VKRLQSITAYLPSGASTFGLGLVSEIFADRRHLGQPAFEVTLCADLPGPVRTDLGLMLQAERGLDELAEGDLVVLLPADTFRSEPSPDVIAAVQKAHRRGAIIVSHCVGSYFLAATGLLNGRKATTHWRFAKDFAARFPEVDVVREALYVDEGQIITGAGAAAGADLYLHLLRREHGASVANVIARDVVIAPHRHGGQAQYIEAPVPGNVDDERLQAVTSWAAANLDRIIPVEELASRALMSPRTFARRFRAVTGSSPHSWLLHQRLARAEDLLENTNLSIEEVARSVGYASAAVLRDQFSRHRGIPPREYRRAFSAAAPQIR
jgi:transcriptional regulator GlxA family with amidase domain